MKQNKNIRNPFFWSLYAIAGIGILLIILFRFFGVIKDFDMEYVYLILMLLALIIFPIVGEFSYGNFKFKSNIGPADKKDIEKEEEEEKKELNSNSGKKNLSATEIKDIKQKMLEQFCQEINVNSKNVLDNQKITNVSDEISSDNPVFTWYFEEPKNIFIEPKITAINSAYHNRLYVMLSKIKVYNKTSKPVSLVLLVKSDKDSDMNVEKLKVNFAPAIKSGLLEVKEI